MGKTDSEDQSYIHQSRQNYSRISKSTKAKLIRLVTDTNSKVSSAAKILKINESTAKMIVRKFKEMDPEKKLLFFQEAQKEKKLKMDKTKKKEKQELSAKVQNSRGPPLFYCYFFNPFPICCSSIQ